MAEASPGREPEAGERTARTRAGRAAGTRRASTVPATPAEADHYRFAAEMRHRRLTTELGWLGRLVGSPKNAPLNITGAVVVGILVVGGVATFVFPAGERIELWKVLVPILAAALGYAFGKKTWAGDVRMKRSWLTVLFGAVAIASALPAAEPEPARSPPAVRVTKNVTYGTAGGEALKLDLAVPAGKGPHPAVVLFHGGAWRYGGRADLSRRLPGDDGTPAPSVIEAVAARGYVVASVGYRLAPKHKFPAQLDDARAAVRFLRANADKYRVDPDRVGAGGFSAGAHLALLLGLTDPPADEPRVRAVVSFFGPTDLSRYAATPGIEAAYMVPWLGPAVRTDPAVYRRASPLTHASPDDPPVLLVHGTADLIVPILHSELLLDKLRAAGVTADLLAVKGEGHGWFGPVAADTTAAAVKFLDERVKGDR